MLKKSLAALIQHLLPPTCLLCGDPARQNRDLCVPCQQELPWLENVCAQCALPLEPITTNQQSCGTCLQTPPPFDKTFTLWRYAQPVDRLITALKFNHQLVYARLLGELLLEHLQPHYQNNALPDLIIPVPLHSQRLKERGFNQALEIARPISKKLRVKLDFLSCQRTRATAAQSSLPARERHRNIKDAFTAANNLQGKHIALLDDVITTGDTVTELSKTLRCVGVARIDVWCCARTLEAHT